MTASPDLWWRDFFAHEDSLKLGRFPDLHETHQEVAGLTRMVGLSPEQRIADICCGYGRHLVALARQGYWVVGVDISPMMLALAQRQLAQAQLHTELIRGDACALPFADESLDVVLNLFNSFGYCQTEQANQHILDETARVLRPGGKFFLDTRNRQHQILFAPRRLPMRTAKGERLILSCHYDQANHRLISEWRRGDNQLVVHRASIRLYGLEELDAMMAAAGLRKLAVYGSYQAAPFAGFERQVLYLAEKPQ